VLQKLAYLIVVLVLLPLMLATGLAMSPGMDAGYPFLLEIFGGRQSARTIHFITASGIVLFVVVHLVMVLISGVWNNLRSMIAVSDEREAISRPARLPCPRLGDRQRFAARRLRQWAFRSALCQAHSREC
jgi:cytochrome b subunit of formate dehydrogenase